MIGQVISHYKILEKLGEGGMGVVYKAQDLKLDRIVALKFLPPHLTANATDKARFLQEAKAAAALNHPNICTIHGIEEDADEQFIVMEYVDGVTLRQKVNAVRTQDAVSLPLNDAISYAIQVAEALSEAHGKAIIHRDIKSDNIMVTSKGHIKIMDFGLAKLKGAMRLTKTVGTVGTLAYMSPEQMQGNEVDRRSDIFSFGVVLFEMLAGRLPFRGEHDAAMMYSILNEDPQPLEKLRADVPTELRNIINRSLEKSREQRYQTIEEIISPLRSLHRGTAAPASSVKRPETRYAKSGTVNIAYQVLGDGSIDIVYVMGWVSNLDYYWEEPSYDRFLKRLASFSRLILFDKRGTGLSDRVHESELPTLEQRMDDVRAVMDAVTSSRAIVFGVSEGGPMSTLFAATYPERTLGLIMYGSYAKRVWAKDYPWAPTPEERQKFFDAIEQGWGGVVDLATLAPTVANDEGFRQWWAAYLRRSASPGAALALAKMNTQIDIRHVLPAIRVPTLIIHRKADVDIHVGGSRFMAQRIPHAKFVELPGDDHLPWVGDQDAILSEVEKFVKTIQHPSELDSILVTVLSVQSTTDDLQRHHSAFKKDIDRFRGKLLQTRGPEIIATFDGPARAIRSALALLDTSEQLGISLKAGLHTGECELMGSALKGAAIQMAHDVRSRAGFGEVLVSRTVKDLVAGSGIEFRDRGSERFPGIDGEWQLFSVVQKDTPDTKIHVKQEKSIAVLPFENIGSDKENEYFSDGVTDDIIAHLSKIQDLKVISRTSSIRYKQSEKPLREIAGELGVSNVLEGSVRRAANKIRVVVQLIEAATDAHLWADTYDRELTDVFAIQTEIAERVTGALKARLTADERSRIVKKPTEDMEAYNFYLLGRYHYNQWDEAQPFVKAIEYFQRAIDHDRGFARAYAALALPYLWHGAGYYGIRPRDAYAKVSTLATRALELDDELAEAHAVLAMFEQNIRFNWDAALSRIKRALELNPNSAEAYLIYGWCLPSVNRMDEAVAAALRAIDLDPASATVRGWAIYNMLVARRPEQALETLRAAEAQMPGDVFLLNIKTFVLIFLGRAKEAVPVAREVAKRLPVTAYRSTLAWVLAAAGEHVEARGLLNDIQALEKTEYVFPTSIALTLAHLGEMDRAFEYLERAYEDRAGWMAHVGCSPHFDVFRSDPRFESLVRRVGAVPAVREA